MTAPGWYPSPSDPPGTRRWWNGYSWTDQIEAPPTPPPAPKPVAGIAPRAAARVVDWAILIVVAEAIHRVWAPRVVDVEFTDRFHPEHVIGTSTPATLLLGTTLVAILWEVFWLLGEGATPGKQLVGLYIEDASSPRGTVEVQAGSRRNAHRLILIVPFGWVAIAASSIVSVVMMHDDRDHRRSLMDRAAGTIVRRVGPASPRFTPWLAVSAILVAAMRALAWVVH